MKKCGKSAKNYEKYETILPFRFLPFSFPLKLGTFKTNSYYQQV